MTHTFYNAATRATTTRDLTSDELAALQVVPVPKQVTPYQARIALLNAGLLATVETLVADPGTPQEIKLAWDWANIWERSSPFVATLGASLGLSDGQIDDLFIAAGMVS